MLFALLIGTILGFIIAIPPGPVAVTVAKLAVFNPRKHSTEFSLATGIVDFIFALSATFAATAVASAIHSFSQDYELLTQIFQLGIVGIFIIYGIFSLVRSKKIKENEYTSLTNKFLDKLSRKGPFFLGFAIAFSNLANPTFLPSLGYLSIQVSTFNFFEMDFLNKIIYSFGFGLGNFLWLNLMGNLVALNKHKFSTTFQQRLHQFAGITFISFGTLIGYKVVQFIHWPDLLRLVLAF
jgi:threonine/homoserine/homoserine lactone efflux protein